MSGKPSEPTGKSAQIFRKVKHLVRAEDGGEAIVTLDLADVPNTVKNTSIKHGWKFSTVLNMAKTTPIQLSAADRAASYGLGEEFYSEGRLGMPEGDDIPVPVPKRAKKRGIRSVLSGIVRREKPKH